MWGLVHFSALRDSWSQNDRLSEDMCFWPWTRGLVVF